MNEPAKFLKPKATWLPTTARKCIRFGKSTYQRGLINMAIGAGCLAGGAVGREQILLTAGSVFLVMGAVRVGQVFKAYPNTSDIKKSSDYQSEDGPL